MEFYNDYLDEFDESSFDDEAIIARIEKSLSWIDDGIAILNMDSIEETILICIENDFAEEGLVLVEAMLEIYSYNSEFWQYKGVHCR